MFAASRPLGVVIVGKGVGGPLTVSGGPRGQSGGRVSPPGVARCGAVHRPRPPLAGQKGACASAAVGNEDGAPRKIRGSQELLVQRDERSVGLAHNPLKGGKPVLG